MGKIEVPLSCLGWILLKFRSQPNAGSIAVLSALFFSISKDRSRKALSPFLYYKYTNYIRYSKTFVPLFPRKTPIFHIN